MKIKRVKNIEIGELKTKLTKLMQNLYLQYQN